MQLNEKEIRKMRRDTESISQIIATKLIRELRTRGY